MDIKNNIFIINGQKTCGKDYLIKELSTFLGVVCVSISTVDVIKEMYEKIGYVEDDPEIKNMFRVVLSDAKDSIDKNLDNWTSKNCVTRAIKSDLIFKSKFSSTAINPLPIFIHNREPEKIELMKKLFLEKGYKVRTLKVESDWQDQTPEDVTCHADENINNYSYDIVFKNTKNIVEFSKRLSNFNTNHII